MPHQFTPEMAKAAVEQASSEVVSGNITLLAVAYSDLHQAAYQAAMMRFQQYATDAEADDLVLDEDAAEIAADRCATYVADRTMAGIAVGSSAAAPYAARHWFPHTRGDRPGGGALVGNGGAIRRRGGKRMRPDPRKYWPLTVSGWTLQVIGFLLVWRVPAACLRSLGTEEPVTPLEFLWVMAVSFALLGVGYALRRYGKRWEKPKALAVSDA